MAQQSSAVKFLSTGALVNVGISLLVVLIGLAGKGRELRNGIQFGGQPIIETTSKGMLNMFSDSGKIDHKDHRTYTYGGILIQRNMRTAHNMFVDQSGSGDFQTVQDAVNNVTDDNLERVIIHVKAGIYKEKVNVPIQKPYITFEGAGSHNTIITWNEDASTTGSTADTASVTIEADYFIARNISFMNTAGIGAQAIALQVSGDFSAFYGCGIHGYQDTLFDKKGRHLFRDCYIEGAVDFIFGNGRSLYERCTINSIAIKSGIITAQSRQSRDELTGFGFVHCTIVGTGVVLLGRAWRPFARVVIASTYMEDIIDSRRWDDWKNSNSDTTLYFGEYNNRGPGANMSGHQAYVRSLSSEDAAEFTQIHWIDGSEWLQD